MADTTKPYSGFSDIVQQIADADIPTMPRKRSQPTTTGSILKSAITEYPRASITAGVVGATGYSAVKGWKSAYKEGLQALRARTQLEKEAVEGLAGKGLGGMTRLKGTNDEIRLLAKEYALEKILTGAPFSDAKAKARIADLKTPRVILNSETVPLVTFEASKAPMFGAESKMTQITRTSPFRVTTDPRQVTAEVANAIPKLSYSEIPKKQAISMGSPENWQGALQAGAGEAGQAQRIARLPKYAPTAVSPTSIPKAIAQLSTSGKLGKANVGLEALALGADIFNSEGDIQRAYREGNSYYGPAGGIVLGGLKTASRAGRGATNALTLGAGEYLGVYDTIDLLGVESEAKRRYLDNRKALKLPVRKVDGEFEPIKDNPYLQMFEAQVASERGIENSLMTQKFYKGPQYDYKVIDGKVTPTLKPDYARVAEAQSLASMDKLNQRRPVLNVDPTLGRIGYQFNAPEAFNFGNYTDYMFDR